MHASEMQAAEYEAWLKKFETKKTTDDCFTPARVYEAVRDWAKKEYTLSGRRIMRPFYPGGDFTEEDYNDAPVVIDNPPFSILKKIIDWYTERDIDYFLFGPALTLFVSEPSACCIVVNVAIIYANGARVNTGFITNLDPARVRTAPELRAAILTAIAANKRDKRKPSSSYSYPNHVLTAAHLHRLASVDFSVPKAECSQKIYKLDAQHGVKKNIFGGGFIISERAAAERAAAERAAAERAAAERAATIKWRLSARELELVKCLTPEAL